MEVQKVNLLLGDLGNAVLECLEAMQGEVKGNRHLMFLEVILQDFRDTFVSKGVIYLRICRASTVVFLRMRRASTVVLLLGFPESSKVIFTMAREHSTKDLSKSKAEVLAR